MSKTNAEISLFDGGILRRAVGQARSRHQRRRPGYVASWGRDGAFAHQFGDRYRTLRVGEKLPDRRRRRPRGGPGRPGFKAWLIGGSPY